MSQASLGHFLARVAQERGLQLRLRHCSVVEAAALARSLGFEVSCGDLLRYESRAFAWPLSDNEYELLARLQRPRTHWWQRCWECEPAHHDAACIQGPEAEEIRRQSPTVSPVSQQ